MPASIEPNLWSIAEYRGRRGLEQLETDWRRLYAAMPARSRCHCFDAHLAWLEHLCAEPDRVRYLALTGPATAAADPGRVGGPAGATGAAIRAIVPLEPVADPSLRLPLRAWALPSHDHWLATDVLASDDGVFGVLLPLVIAHLRRHREGRGLLLLGPTRGDRALCDCAILLPEHTRCRHDTHPSASLDATLPYDQLIERMSKHFRRNLRSHQNKLRAAGEVRLSTVSSATVSSADGPAALLAAFDDFLAIEASGWKGKAGAASAIGLRPHLVAFYRALLTTMTAPADHCEINTLYLDGRCIAAQFCTRTGAEYTILKIAYDEDFARLGPGQLLFQTTLERCCADPDVAYVDLITYAPWMRDWSAEVMPMQQSHISLSPLWGRALIAVLQFRHGPARRWVRKYRSSHADRRQA